MLTHQQKVVEKQGRHLVVGRHEVVSLLLQPLAQRQGLRFLVANVTVQYGADDVVARDVKLLASGGGLGLLLALSMLLRFLVSELIVPLGRRLVQECAMYVQILIAYQVRTMYPYIGFTSRQL